MWELEGAGPPADREARRIQLTLAQSRARYVSPELEFAVWAATIGEGGEGEPVTVTGPLGHVTAGEQLVCSGAFSRHPWYGWQFSVETFRSALPQSPEGIACGVPKLGAHSEKLAICTQDPDFGTPPAEELVVLRRGVEHVVGRDPSSTPDLDFAWSSNGRWLAFRTETRFESRTDELDLVHPDGSGRRRLLRPPATGRVDFAWSPDGRWLAYSSDGSNELDLVHPDGSGRRRLFDASVAGLACFCCHDGLLVADLTSGSRQRVPGYSGGFFTWSPRGHLLAFSASDGIRIIDRAGRTRTITPDQPQLELWSPDGKWIAYTTSESPSSPAFYLRVASVSGRVRTLVASAGAYGGMLWGFTWKRKPRTVHYRPPTGRSLATVSPDQLTAPWSIERIAAAGGRVAYVACGHVFVWTPAARAVVQTEPVASMAPNCRTGNYSTSYDVYDLALASDRLVYAAGEGCNSIRIALRLEEVAQRKSRSDIAQALGNCGGPFHPALGELAGSADLLVYGEWWQTSSIPVLPPFSITSEEIHRIDGNGCPCPTMDAGLVYVDGASLRLVPFDQLPLR